MDERTKIVRIEMKMLRVVHRAIFLSSLLRNSSWLRRGTPGLGAGCSAGASGVYLTCGILMGVLKVEEKTKGNVGCKE